MPAWRHPISGGVYSSVLELVNQNLAQA